MTVESRDGTTKFNSFVHGNADKTFRLPDHQVGSLRKTSVWVARDMAAQMTKQRLEEGTRLPPEHDLIDTYKVGRSTLREALRILEMRGLIVIRPGRTGGPVVRHPKAADLSESLSLVLQYQGATLASVIDARLFIEPAITRLAASKVTPAVLEELRSTVDSMIDNPKSETNFSIQNALFHQVIAESVDQPVLASFLESLKFVHDGRSQGVSYSDAQVRAVIRAHQRIIDALERRNPESAEAAMRKHMTEARNYWRSEFPTIYQKTLQWLEDN